MSLENIISHADDIINVAYKFIKFFGEKFDIDILTERETIEGKKSIFISTKWCVFRFTYKD